MVGSMKETLGCHVKMLSLFSIFITVNNVQIGRVVMNPVLKFVNYLQIKWMSMC